MTPGFEIARPFRWKTKPRWVVILLSMIAIAGLGCSGKSPTVSKPALEKASSGVTDSVDSNVESTVEKPPSEVLPTEPLPTDIPEPSSDSKPTDSSQVAMAPTIPDGKWTKQRLILLNTKGPVVFDLMLRVGGHDLDGANKAAVEPIQKSLIDQLGESPKWDSLLEVPLVKSGWIGNLVADGDQVSQLVGMYDKNKDTLVQADELTDFLTRGLSKNQPIGITDAGSEPSSGSSSNAFGVLDVDEDNVLSLNEVEGGSAVLTKLDFNGDSSVSLSEVAPPSQPNMAEQRMVRTMMQANSLVHYQPAQDADEKTARRLMQRKVNDVLEYYSNLGSIDRSRWSAWNDVQWKLIDANGDDRVDKSELATIFTLEPVVQIAIDLPSPHGDESQIHWYCSDLSNSSTWSSKDRSGELRSLLCNIRFDMDDVFSGKVRPLLKDRMNESFKNAQVKQFLVQQLQLKEGALELADADSDQKISDSEIDEVWKWLAARQSARLQGRWMLAARPWFQMLDTDLNGSISQIELIRLAETYRTFDLDNDGLVDSDELPTSIRLQLTRADQRIDLRGLVIPGDRPVGGGADSNWFAAMDTNRDGSIGKQEFLGTNDEFKSLDRNGDGFILESEVY
jgi:Ca2+-binding EF-hand superfamily protein